MFLFICCAHGQTEWLASLRHGDEARFLTTNQIQRYDLASKAWLPSVTLPRSGATAMASDGQGTAVAYGASIYRYSTSLASEVSIASTSTPIQSLFFDGNLLIAVHSSGLYARITVFNRTSGAQLSTIQTYVSSIYGASHAPGANRLYGRTQGISPQDIVTASYTDAGVISNSTDSSYHGDYPNAAKTWIFPNEERVLDSSGTVYTTPGLSYAGSLAGSLIDIAFHGDVPIVLRTNELVSFSSNLVQAGKLTVAAIAASKLHVTGNDAFVFSPTTGAPAVQIFSLSSLSAPQPGTPINPLGLPYTVDDAFLDKDGNVLLFSKSQLSLFRWSPSARAYTSSIPLIGVPSYAGYSPQDHSAYFAYDSQVIRKLDLSVANPKEVSLVNLPAAPSGFTMAGEFAYAASVNKLHTFSNSGSTITTTGFTYYYGSHNVWDPVKRRVYHFRDGISPNDLHYDTINSAGSIASSGETPYHGDFNAIAPIRVSPDGSKVAIGSGVVFNAEGLTIAANLSNSFTDGTWVGSRFVTLRLISGITQLQVWEGNQFLPGSIVRQFNGTPLRLFNTPQGPVVITSVDNTPRFTLLDENFNAVFISPTRPLAPGNLASIGRTVDSVSLSWVDNSDNEENFRVDYRIGSGAWTSVISLGSGTTTTTVTGLASNTEYQFRVIAITGSLESPSATPILVRTLSSPDELLGEPYSLRVTRIFQNSVTLDWQDNASNETAFRILYSTTRSGPTAVSNFAADSTTGTISGLSSNTNYYFRVQVIKDDISGDLSAAVEARTMSSVTVPAIPTSVTTTNVLANSVTLSWTDASTNEDGFRIERSGSSSGPWTTLINTSFNAKSYKDTTVAADKLYFYRIAAFNTTGISSYRSVSVTTSKLGGTFSGFAMRSNRVHYFAFTGPNRIERYDLSSRTWLTAIPLNAPATALWVDESAIFVAEDRSVLRFALDGSNRTAMGNAQSTVSMLFTLKDLLVFSSGNRIFTSANKITGNFLTNFEYRYMGSGFSIAPDLNRVYFRSTGVSPSDIHYWELGTDGKLVSGKESPYHGAYSSATRTFVFPNGGRVVDDSGIVYSTDSLTYTNTLGAAFTDLAFHGEDVPIVLRGSKLFSYTSTLLEAGAFTLSAEGIRVSVDSQDAIVFFADGTSNRGLRTEIVSLSSLNAPEPGLAIEPNGLPFSVDDAFVDRDGNLLFFNKAQMSLFQWSPLTCTYTGSIPLIGVPDFAAYSKENHTAYFAYGSQIIREMNLNGPEPAEQPLFSLPKPATGLATAGEFIFASDPSGAWHTHYTFSPTGQMIQSLDWNRRSRVFEWDPVKRRMYFFRDDTSPNDLHYETIDATGKITGSGETPYHGDFSINTPIRVSPSGANLVIGSGVIFETASMTKLATTIPAFSDGIWWGDKLITLHLSGTRTLVRSRSAATLIEGPALPLFQGTPIRILALTPQTIALVTSEKGIPRIYLLNQNLEVIHSFISTPPAVEDAAYTWKPTFEWSTLGTGALTVTARVLPSWLTFINGVLSGTPSEADSGDRLSGSKAHRVVLRAVNAQNQVEERDFLIHTNWQNDAPSLPLILAPVTANLKGEDVTLNLAAQISDPDANDTHTWQVTENSNPSIFSSLENDSAGQLNIKFAPYVSGVSIITLRVTDAYGKVGTTAISVTLPVLPEPSVTIDSTPTLNRLTGLYEQKITVTNIAQRAIAGFDITISGLRTGVNLYNGSSTGQGSGIIAHHLPLAAGASVSMVLEYFASPRGTVPSPVMLASVTNPSQLTLNALRNNVPSFEINRLLKLGDGSVVLEFTATPGTYYRVQYSEDANHWKTCPTSIRASGTKVQWIDRGPPWTDSPPSTAPRRFYRIESLNH